MTPVEISKAACVGEDPETFFPSRGGSAREAKEICARCPVRRACLEVGLSFGGEFGIFGGTTPLERRAIRQQRRRAGTLARRNPQRDPAR